MQVINYYQISHVSFQINFSGIRPVSADLFQKSIEKKTYVLDYYAKHGTLHLLTFTARGSTLVDRI